MPGLGRKVFSAGEVLTAANVQGYLMDQSVGVFASSTARSSALGTAVSAGMVSYRSDDKALELYAGSAWQPVVQNRNVILNSAFDIWQRGTSFTLTNGVSTYTADRWAGYFSGANGTISQQTFTPGAAPVSGYEGATYLRAIKSAVAGYIILANRIEDVRTFAGQTVTFSFWARVSSGTFSATPYLRQNFGSGGSSGVDISLSGYTLTTSWQRFVFTYALPSVSGKTIGSSSYLEIDPIFNETPSGVTFDVWGVQIEAGSVATPFQRNGENVQAELAACQRYYWRNNSPAGQSITGHGSAYSTGAVIAVVTLPVEMRTVPSAVEYSGISVNDGVTAYTVSAVALLNPTGKTVSLNAYGAT